MKTYFFGVLCCFLFLIVSGVSAEVSAEKCPNFQYVATASAEVTDLTSFEAYLTVPSAPTDSAGDAIPPWGIFPFIEPAINANDPRYGILQPVLEWNYQGVTKSWTITPWYEDYEGHQPCGDGDGCCKCTPEQKALNGGGSAQTKNYYMDVPDCHNRCEPKQGQRITASSGDTIHFIISRSGDFWITTALNTNTNEKTSFRTHCIHPNDKLKIGFALENSVGYTNINKNNPKVLPGNIKFTNIQFQFSGGSHTIQLQPTIDPAPKSCFPWFDVNIDNGGFWGLGQGNTKTVMFKTQPYSEL